MTTAGVRKDGRLLSDEELINRIVGGGSPELFDIVYERYREKVFGKCRYMLKDDTLASDFTQDIFSKILVKLPSFRRESSFSTWLYAITYHYCIEYLRRMKSVHYPSWNSRHELPDVVDESEEDLSAIKYEHLLKVLEMIHPEEKALLFMKYQDDLPMKMISQVLRISESAVKMRIKRAKARVVYLYNLKFKDDVV